MSTEAENELRAAAAVAAGCDRVRIQVRAGQRPQAVEAVLDVLHEKAADAGLYACFGVLVTPFLAEREGFTDERGRPEPVQSLELERLALVNLQMSIDRLCVFIRSRPNKDGSWRTETLDCPEPIAKSIYTSGKALQVLPQIERIAEVPVFDGKELFATPGLHGTTWINAPSGVALPAKLSKEAAAAALARVREWLAEFPFEQDESAAAGGVGSAAEAVAVALLMTAALRPSLPRAPGFMISKPSYGAGATMLASVAGVLYTGRSPPVINFEHQEESRKQLNAALIAGRPLLIFDNLADGRAFSDSLVAQLLHEFTINVRELGTPRNVDCDTRRLVIMTGVNISPDADLVRRVLVCALDPKLERPEERTFKRPDLIGELHRARAAVLSDMYTITACYLAAGVRTQVGNLVGYERFRQWVVEPLCWLGMPDILAARKTGVAADSTVMLLAELLPLIEKRHSYHPEKAGLITGELLKPPQRNDDPDNKGLETYNQIVAVLGEATNARKFEGQYQLDTARVGTFLRKVLQRIVTVRGEDGVGRQLRLVLTSRDHIGRPRYRVEEVVAQTVGGVVPTTSSESSILATGPHLLSAEEEF